MTGVAPQTGAAGFAAIRGCRAELCELMIGAGLAKNTDIPNAQGNRQPYEVGRRIRRGRREGDGEQWNQQRLELEQAKPFKLAPTVAPTRAQRAMATILGRAAHPIRLRLHPQLGKQAGQQRVMELVVDDEPTVDGRWPTFDIEQVGMRVATQIAIGLEQRHLVLWPQQPGATKAGDAGTDHRDAHQARAFAITWVGTGFSAYTSPRPSSSRNP